MAFLTSPPISRSFSSSSTSASAATSASTSCFTSPHTLPRHTLRHLPHPQHHSSTIRAVASPPPDGLASFSGKIPETTTAPPSPNSDNSKGDAMHSGWCFGQKSVEDALRDVKAGKFIVVVDDENRENEGDLIIAADRVTPEAIAFMVRHTSGVICCAMEGDRLNALNLTQMVPNNTDPKNTAFTVTCDLHDGTSTGISAEDRAKTLVALASPSTQSDDFNRPGHIFPLRYCEGGVLKRAGHTEASVDFSRLAGCAPVGVLSEIVNDSDGSMARLPQLKEFVKQHNLVLTSIADLVMYRRCREKLVERIGEAPARLPTKYGVFDAYAYRSLMDGIEHVALVVGSDNKTRTENNAINGTASPSFEGPVLVRVHSECCTGDVFGSLRCDCGPQLDFAMREIAATGRGILIYLRGQEGRGIGLGHKMRAYALQDKGRDTVQANEDLGLPVDSREYGIGAQILADLNVSEIILMTNNPAKYSGLGGYGLKIVERMSVQISSNPENEQYLQTKKNKMGHWLNLSPLAEDEDTVPATYKVDSKIDCISSNGNGENVSTNGNGAIHHSPHNNS